MVYVEGWLLLGQSQVPIRKEVVDRCDCCDDGLLFLLGVVGLHML